MDKSSQKPIELISENLKLLSEDIKHIRNDVAYIKNKLKLILDERDKDMIKQVQASQDGWWFSTK